MNIKLLGPSDHAVLADVAPDVFDGALRPAAIDEFLHDSRHHLVVAIDDGRVVGFASAVHYVHPDKTAPELWINEIGVSPAYQGRGAGKAMLRKLLDHAGKLGCTEAWVLTNRSNRAAMRLYESAGGVTRANDEVMFNFELQARDKLA